MINQYILLTIFILIITCFFLITSIKIQREDFEDSKPKNNVFDMFEKIYIINLNRRKDRKEYIEKEIGKYTNNYEIISAVDGNDIDIDNLENNIISEETKKEITSNKKKYGLTLTNGAIGCALSHKKIWEMIHNQNYDNVLILEDDVQIQENIKNLKNIYNDIPSDWDIIYLGSGQYYKKDKITDNIHKLKFAFGTFGYILSSKTARKLLQSVFPIKYQIDSSIQRNVKGLITYIVEPNVIKPRRDMKTDIQVKDYFSRKI